MKPFTYSSLGWQIEFNQAESVDEYNRIANSKGKVRENPCLEDANSTTAYRGQMNGFRDGWGTKEAPVDGIIDFIEKDLNLPRKTKVEQRKQKDGSVKEVTVIDEDAGEYLKRVDAHLFPGDPDARDKRIEKYAADAKRIALAVPFDPSEAESKGKAPKEVFPKYIRVLVAGWISKGELEKRVRQFTKLVGHEVEPSELGLLRAVSEDQASKLKY